jgi:hypothetical protein
MAWRKIQKEDIKRGAIIKIGSIIADGGYGLCTIISTREAEAKTYPHVMVARPQAFAHEHFDGRTPMLHAEVFDLGISNLLNPNADYEVFQGRDGSRMSLT